MNHEDTKNTKEREERKEGQRGSLIQRDHGETLAWCFLPRDGRLRIPSPDGIRRLIQENDIIRVHNPMEMRHQRIHSAERAIDALFFGRGLVVCRVRLRGTILRERQIIREYTPFERNFTVAYGNKMIVLGAQDGTTIIHGFMCDVAEWALLHGHLPGINPDRRLLDAIAAKRAWLHDKISREDRELAEITAEWAWREIWQAQNLGNVAPFSSPYAPIVAWATHPRTIIAMNAQMTADFEARRTRVILTNAITPQSDLNAELEQRLTEAFGDTASM